MNKSLLIMPVVIVSVVGIVYGFAKNSTMDSSNTMASSTATPMMASEAMPSKKSVVNDEHNVILAGTRIDLQNANSLKPGDVTLAFKLYGIDAHEFGADDLKITNEKLMHLILVRDDVNEFQHLHPEYQDGRWIVTTNIPEQGLYQMYLDIEPKEEKLTTLRMPITIGGSTMNAQFPDVSNELSAVAGDIQATLQIDAPLQAKEEVKLNFILTQNGKPVNQIDSYLGALGHVVVIRHTDVGDYSHGHPITKTNASDGKITFEAVFPAQGMYTIFAQFNISGQVKTFPITVRVGDKGQTGTNDSGH